jgi:GTP-binding protein
VVGRRALARTSRTPGRTRACNVFRVAERYYLVDLPGYGYARLAGAERRRLGQLIDAYLANRRSLAGVVWLLDMRHDPSVDDARAARNLVTHGRPVLVALTKADKVPRGRRPERIAAIGKAVGIPEDQCVVTSARTREGIAELRDAINGLVAP